MNNNEYLKEKDISLMLEMLKSKIQLPDEMKDTFLNLFVYLLVM